MGYTQLTLNANNFSTNQDIDAGTFANVVDNDGSTNIEIGHNGADFPITYTFNIPQFLNKIAIQWDSIRYGEDYLVQVSIDGVNFTTIPGGNVTGNTSATLLEYPFAQPYINPQRYKAFRFFITDEVNVLNVKIRKINAYIPDDLQTGKYTQKDFNIEFNDSILDLDGWKNPRYEGSKLIGSKVNNFNYGINPVSSKRNKILTNTEDTLYAYGPKPVIERKSTALFIGSTIQQGDVNNASNIVVDIKNHSYVSVDKIILLNPNSTQGKDAIIEVITKESVDNDTFNQLLIDNCPEGSKVKIRLLDREISNTLKNSYSVKFNRGTLMKIYSYTADTASGTDDGVFGGYGIRSNQGSLPDNLTSGSTNLSSSGLFGFGMTTFASHSRFTSSITMINDLPSELSLYNTDIDNIIELNPITASGVPGVTPPPTTEGGDFNVDNTTIGGANTSAL